VVIARLQGDHRGTAGGPGAGAAQRHHLGVRVPGRLGAADPGDLPGAVEDHRTDRRVRIGRALDVLGLFDGEPHGPFAGLGQGHNRRCGEDAPAWRRNAATAAAGSSAP
jgi:hypothetical protein